MVAASFPAIISASLVNVASFSLLKAVLSPDSERKSELLNLAQDDIQNASVFQTDSNVNILQGKIQFFNKNPQDAVESLLKGVLLNQDNTTGHIFLAKAYQDLDKEQEAMLEWGKVDGANYFYLRKDYQTAIVLFENQLNVQKNLSDFVYLGSSYEALDQWEKARDTYLRQIQAFPQNVDGYERLSRVSFWFLDDAETAFMAKQRVLQLTPENERYDVYTTFGDMLWLKMNIDTEQEKNQKN